MSVSTLQLAADVYTMSAGRIGASLAAVLGLAGAVLAWFAGRGGRGGRSGRSGDASWAGRHGVLVALIAGPLGFLVGGLVVVTAEGGLGTGNGLGGGVVAMVFGLLSTALGLRARSRAA
ncbi:DUF6223 family protein [Streptomyces sp. NPDC048604]|uniref:DUF6223 family protein n=1 Tax=Streptomyces sp. NPDC048604 TaxID=3365578 RepID=UPI00371634F7